MEQAVDQGLVRQLGISHCYDEDVVLELCASARVQPSVLQNRFYAESGDDKQLRALCRARSIVYQSSWTLTANQHLLQHTVVRGLAKTHRRTAAQILFRYLSQEGVVPLTGTVSTEHMTLDLAIFDLELRSRSARR